MRQNFNHTTIKQVILFCSLAVFLMSGSCTEEDKPVEMVDWNQVEDQLIESHKYNTEKENLLIQEYISNKEWSEMKETPTGLRYMIYNDIEGTEATALQWVQVNYSVSLLNDSLLYETNDEPRAIHIDMDDVPTGMHEGLKLMSKGDEAWFILPSRLAYGLTGDQISIPMNSCIVMNVEIIDLR